VKKQAYLEMSGNIGKQQNDRNSIKQCMLQFRKNLERKCRVGSEWETGNFTASSIVEKRTLICVPCVEGPDWRRS